MSDSYGFPPEEEYSFLEGSFYGNGRPPVSESGGPGLAGAALVKGKKKSVKRSSMDNDELRTLLHGSDPVIVELTRLENEVRDKDRELELAQSEIKALKYQELRREKAVEELTENVGKLDGKLKANEILLENKNLEIKKINDEKKAALAAQFAAEATLRRVHAAQKDDDMPPIEAVIAPLEAELKLARQEISKLQEDNRALDRLTKSKEAALLDAERTVEFALIKAALVDDLQNKNQELMKQIDICQEDNKILDKLHRQKVSEVEKLTQTVRDLEEAVLAGGASANAVRDLRRKVQEMNEELKTVKQELARTKISANRVATVVANAGKDGNDKVMPVKQWLEERRVLQGEMQQLRDKLAIVERAARSEALLKDRYQLRLKVLEDGLRSSPNGVVRPEVRSSSNGRTRRQSLGGAEIVSRLASNGLGSRRQSVSQLRATIASNTNTVLKHSKGTSRSFDGGRSVDRSKPLTNGFENHKSTTKTPVAARGNESQDTLKDNSDNKPPEFAELGQDDSVSGLLYDMLQKEVITLRKASHEKDQALKDKDDAIEMLSKKCETLSKAMDVESKKMRRDMATLEKEVSAMRVEKEHDQRARRMSSSKAGLHNSHLFSGRGARNT